MTRDTITRIDGGSRSVAARKRRNELAALDRAVSRCSKKRLIRLQDYRERNGLSLRELARLAGVTYVTVFYLEHGLTLPRTSTARALASALGVSVYDLTRPYGSEERA